MLTWAFEFEDQPYFPGFRQLTSAGIDLPVMNMFKLFAKMSGHYVPALSDHQQALDQVMQNGVRGEPDIGSVATVDGARLAVLVWHYHDDDLAGPDARVHVDLKGLPRAFAGGATLVEYRIDRNHSNSYATWLAMGSPIAPNDRQRADLLRAAQLSTVANTPASVAVSHGQAGLDFTLPRQGVSLIVLTPASTPGRR